MSELGKRLITSLKDAADNPDGVKRHDVSEVRRIRTTLNMSVREFSETFHLPKRTVEKWDMQDTGLTGAASTLVKIIDKNPKAVMQALQD